MLKRPKRLWKEDKEFLKDVREYLEKRKKELPLANLKIICMECKQVMNYQLSYLFLEETKERVIYTCPKCLKSIRIVKE